MFRRTFIDILAITLPLTTLPMPVALPQQATTQPALELINVDERIERVDRVLMSIDTLRDQIDRSQFDLGALIERLEYDADEIIRFVKEEIYFEQYPGVLRGAKGTLMSRSGNALDQAILLATLLRDAGLDARIVHGEISESDALAMLNRMRAPIDLFPLLDASAFADTLTQLTLPSGISTEAIMQSVHSTKKDQLQGVRARYAANAERISARLLEELDEVRGSDAWNRSLPVAEARDYYWVQSRLENNRTWSDLHPAWTSEQAGPSSASISATFSEEIPSNLVQTVQLVLTGERVIGRNREQVTLLRMDPTPSTNLIGVPLSLMFLPMDPFETVDELADALPNAELFVPMLNQAPGDYVVDLRGYFIPAAEAQSSSAGVFREGARAVSDAIGALQNLSQPPGEDPQSATALTGLWLDFRIHLPDGQIQEYRRTIIDRILGDRDSDQWSIDSSSADQLRDMILGARHTLLETGHGSAAFKLDESLSYARRLAMLDRYQLNQEAGASSAPMPEIPPIVPPFMHLALFDVFDQAKDEDPSEISYRSIPSIVTIEFKGNTSENGEVTPQITVDIVTNERRVYVRQGAEFVPSIDDAVYLGVFETLAEGSILPPGGASRNAGMATIAALDEQTTFVVLKPEAREPIANLRISPISERAIKKELDQGYWIVGPALSVNARPEAYVWWRVHPTTGNALGMIHTGQGAEATAYTALQRIQMHAAATLTIAFSICAQVTAGAYIGGLAQSAGNMQTASAGAAKIGGTCVKLGATAAAATISYITGTALYAAYGLALGVFLTWATY